jgi:hypothetical protein
MLALAVRRPRNHWQCRHCPPPCPGSPRKLAHLLRRRADRYSGIRAGVPVVASNRYTAAAQASEPLLGSASGICIV